MNISETVLPGVLLLVPKVFRDDRGRFLETYNHARMGEAGLPTVWVQDNFSVSRRNVIRGIHYQIQQAQAKLVRVVSGAALDVAVDLRRSSPNFGRSVAVELTAERGETLLIPAGFGHGFRALTDEAGMAYKVSDYYSPQDERTILWNDPEIGIHWGLGPGEAILSQKDAQGVLLSQAEVFA